MAAAGAPTGGDIKLGHYNINLLDELGRGTFGTVYKGVHEKNKGVVAVKKIQIKDNKAGMEGLDEIKKFEKIELHPNVVRLLDFHYLDTSFWMVMEFCEAGDIDAYMRANDVEVPLRFKFVVESADALRHMHNQVVPIVHRDIKPGNILIKMVKDVATVKLTDFGLSKVVDAEDMMKTAMFNTVVGTPGFMAPELYLKQPYNQAVDIFAMGLVFLSIVDQKGNGPLCPLSTSGAMMTIGQEMMIADKMNSPMPLLVKDDPSDDPKVKVIKQAIKQMTGFDPRTRISMAQVMNILNQDASGSAVAGASAKAQPTEKLFSRKRVPTPPPEYMKSTSSTSSMEENEDDEDGLGMVLLKQALEERVDQMVGSQSHAEKKRIEEASTIELFKRAFDRDKFNVGEKVRIESDLEKAKRLQRGHGGWNDKMKNYLGEVGTVEAKRFMQIDVKFPDGRKWSFNPEIVQKLDLPPIPGDKPRGPTVTPRGGGASRATAAKSLFRNNDIVKIISDPARFERLQKEAGLWQDWLSRVVGTTGIVHKVDPDGDVVVEIITGEKIYVHGDCLTHLDQTGMEVESGDLVFVINDVEKVKRNQQGHGGWHEDMKELVGKATTVKKVIGDKAILEDNGKRWALNVKSVQIVAKNNDLMKAVFAKQSSGLASGDSEIPCRVQ